MSKDIDLKQPKLLINRELSWLEFNDRVLKEGLCEELPLGERLKFLSIVSSNLDEFFMIRIAGLRQQRASEPRKQDPSGLTAAQQLDLIGRRVHKMVAEQTKDIKDVFAKLKEHGFSVLSPNDWT